MVLDWLSDPKDKRIKNALTRTCDICGAKVKALCTSTISADQPLPGRLVHLGRLTERNTK